ncbi:MAG TPA: PAS domain S-box protein, partial [Planctomycetota bacterium]|nr:PAS domain S-box protein [Planctomycetota bacterium]
EHVASTLAVMLGARLAALRLLERTRLRERELEREVAEHRDAERRLAAQHAVSIVLAESRGLDEAAARLIQVLAGILDWDVGALWVPDARGEALRCLDAWHAPTVDAGEFEAVTRDTTFRRGAGMPGRAWATRSPEWLGEVHEEPGFARRASAARAGLRTAIAFPIVRGGEVLAVGELLSRSRRAPADDVLKLLDGVGKQIGQFVERVRAEAARRLSDARFRRLFESHLVGICVGTLDGRITEANDAALAMEGYSRDDLRAGRFRWDRLIPPEHAAAGERIGAELARAGVAGPLEMEHVRKDGTRYPLLIAMAVLEEAGARSVLTLTLDMTARKRAEAALRESEERFRQLAENINAVFWMTTADQKQLLYLSPAFEEIFGRTRESVLARPESWLEGIHPDDRALVREVAYDRPGKQWERTYRVVRPDGAIRWVRDRSYPVHGPDGRIVRLTGIAEDITDLRSTEEQLLQAQKMEAVGRLAGSVAHDFNNILTAITGYSDLVLMRLTEGDPLRGDVDEIKKAAFRATSLTRQLLAFSRKQVASPVALDLNAAVRNMENLLRRLIGEDVALTTRLGASVGAIRADGGQVEQVIMNLAVNARDAMSRGGKLVIATEAVEVDVVGAARRGGMAPGAYGVLEVADTGCGMTAEVRSRIFEPFFTTKEPGKGTGLGLATVFGIAKHGGGHVEVESEPGRGATFRVYFPRTSETPQGDAGPAAAAPGRGSETILLVEDDDHVRGLSQRILEMTGYRVLAARSGADALLLSGGHAGPIHALVTDVIMPELSGRDVAERMVRLRPGIKVLFLSGYAGAVEEAAALAEGAAFLEKPFTPERLAGKVRELLEGR